MEKIFVKADDWLNAGEKRIGLFKVSIVAGLLFLGFAALSTSLQPDVVHHGRGFTQLSRHPFNFSDTNDLRYRILSPLLGYLLFFRGPAFKYFMLIVLVIFLGMIYYYCRKKQLRPSESVLILAVFSFTTLTFHQLNYPAYNDPTTYLLILILMLFFTNMFVRAAMLSLLLFNHENTLFLFPFFFLLITGNNFSFKNISVNALLILLVCVPYFAYRKFVSLHQPVEYSMSYYFDPHNMEWTRQHVLPNLAAGIFQSFRLFWIFPLSAVLIDIIEKRFLEAFLIVSVLFGVMLQFFIAYDISRLAGLVFPAVLVGVERVRAFTGSEKFLKAALIIIFLNFFIPSYYVGALGATPLKPWWL